jgi:glycerophosphoryl diester phosphodiesterase
MNSRTILTVVVALLLAATAYAQQGYDGVIAADSPSVHLNCNDGGVAAATAKLNHATPLVDLERKQTDIGKLAENCTIEWWQFVPPITAAQPVFQVGEQMIGVVPVAKPKPKDAPAAYFTAGTIHAKSPITGGKWFHVAFVRTGGKAQFFVNGQPDGEPQPLALGEDLKLSSNAIGETTIDELAIYDAALPPEKILIHFKAALSPRKVTTVGHRGDNHGSPENTNISYVNAIAMKTPIVEMDLRLTKDNVLVLLHDASVDRTSNGKGKIVEMSLADAEKLDAGTWKDPKYKAEPIPRVETIANTCRDKAIMMLDLKCTGLGPSLAELRKKLDFPAAEQWILAPWEDDEGVELRKYLPDVPMIRLTSKTVDRADEAYFSKMKSIGFSGFSVDWHWLSLSFINAAHHAGMKVYTWTINDAADIDGAVLAGVDGVITDQPSETMGLIGELTKP